MRVEVNSEYFRIADNCGGISVDIARNYAFRFGRPKDAPETTGSIGQFGVGMKRTFFKLGSQFRVESATDNSKFLIEIDVEEWLSHSSSEGADDWHFKFKNLEENISILPEQQGTVIMIDKLYPSVSESFSMESFRTRLSNEIATAHTLNLDNGICITINGIPLNNDPLTLLNSDQLQPAFLEITYDKFGPKPITVKLYAGVSGRSKEEGGWYIFCNGRMVVRADQSNLTVWGEGDGGRVPKYHPEFARFRGLAYFDSDDSSLLPWTTTKTGIDSDSPIYRAVRQQMIEITHPVLDFLRRVEEERKQKDNDEIIETPLASALISADISHIENLSLQNTFFKSPKHTPPSPGPQLKRIQYSKPVDQVDKVKSLLGASSLKEIGEKTFEYYLAYEGDDNDK